MSDELLGDYLRRRAQADPAAAAIVDRGVAVSYGALDDLGRRLGALLQEHGCKPGDRVCLLLPKSTGAVAAMHAVLQAGCIYVPVDLGSPAPRIADVVRAVEPSALLVAGRGVALADELFRADATLRTTVGAIEEGSVGTETFASAFSLEDCAAAPELRPFARVDASTPAHILFTSGSTGKPKGVMVTHANVRCFVDWATSYFGMLASDQVSSHPPLHFDLSTFDIYGAIAAGATLHLVPPEANVLPRQLVEFIRSSNLTQWFSVPSALTLVAKADAIDAGSLPALTRVLACGETLPAPTLAYWMERVPEATFTNLYGPTETTIASSYYTVSGPPEPHEDVPIGCACGGEEVLVLDERLGELPVGETGAIYVGGRGVTAGYWRDEAATAAAFVSDPRRRDDSRLYRTGDLGRIDGEGLLHFAGRVDDQIKSRGHRIEPAEIELALASLDRMREVAVVGAASDGFEGTVVCCAYSTVGGEKIEPATLRRALREVLPQYMIPTQWLQFDFLPKNANGKIDRSSIRNGFEARAVAGASVD
jgi:amino acid adenylation domain-containing protein